MERELFKIARQLVDTAEGAASAGQPTMIGDRRAEALRTALRPILPGRYGIGTGRAFGLRGELSNEQDIIFWNKLESPQFVALSENNACYPSLGVLGTIEVKSTLSTVKLTEGLKQVQSFKALYQEEHKHPLYPPGYHRLHQGREDSARPFSIIFSYKSALSLSTIAQALEELEADVDRERRCDAIVVHDTGIVMRGANDAVQLIQTFSNHRGDQLIARSLYLGTFGAFYAELSLMLASVKPLRTYPSLFVQSPIIVVDKSTISGQFREINNEDATLRALKPAFLRKLIDWLKTASTENVEDLQDRLVHVPDFERLRWSGPLYVYDPDQRLASQPFPPTLFGGILRVTLYSGGKLLGIDGKVVYVVSSYITKNDVTITRA